MSLRFKRKRFQIEPAPISRLDQGLAVAILLASMLPVAQANYCHAPTTWPKLIGYGEANTEVVSVARCASNGKLALAIKTAEPKLVGNSTPASGGNQPLMIAQMDPASAQYDWTNVIDVVKILSKGRNPPVVIYTPDCSKVLLSYADASQKRLLLYVEAATGAKLSAASHDSCCPDIRPNGFTTNNDGSSVWSIDTRWSDRSTTIVRFGYNVATNAFDSTFALVEAWHWSSRAEYNAEILFSDLTANHKVLSLSVAEDAGGDGPLNHGCRLDIWDANFATDSDPEQHRSTTGNDRHCRFPHLIKLAAKEHDDTELVLMQLTEDMNNPQAGVLITRLKIDYTFAQTGDNELIFTTMKLNFLAAYYPSATEAYGVAVDRESSKVVYLIKFDLAALKADSYPIRGLDQTPNAASNASRSILDAVIYSKNSQAGNFPVNGFIVGRTKAVSAYNDNCSDASLSLSNEYINCFPITSSTYGFVERIELDSASCKREKINPAQAPLSAGAGRRDTNGRSKRIDPQLNSAGVSVDYQPLKATSSTGISPGDWEQSIDFTECSKLTADLAPMTFSTEPSFQSTNVSLDYIIGTGQTELSFTNVWRANANQCSVRLRQYLTAETTAGVHSADLSVSTPTNTDTVVLYQSSDTSIREVSRKITLFSQAGNFQCAKTEVTVLPRACEASVFDPITWIINEKDNLNMLHALVGVAEERKFSVITHSFQQQCPDLYYWVQIGAADGWEPYLDSNVVLDGPGKKVTVLAQSWESHLVAETVKLRIAVAAVDSLPSAMYPGYLELDVMFSSPCPYLGLEMLGEYKLIESSELTENEESSRFPSIQSVPLGQFHCGNYLFELVEPVPASIKEYVSVSNSGEVVVLPPPEGTAGTHKVTVRVSFEEYPNVNMTAPVTINVAPCIPSTIEGPRDHFREVKHKVGSSGVTSVPIGEFTKKANCKAPLIFKVLTQNDQPLPSAIKVAIAKGKLEVATMDAKLAGTYSVKIMAQVSKARQISASFSFKLKLFAPLNPKNSKDSSDPDSDSSDDGARAGGGGARGGGGGDIVVATSGEGPLAYQIPEKFKSATQVDLGSAQSFLVYAQSEGTLAKANESFSIPNGVFKVVLSGYDEEAEENWSQNVLFLVGVKIGAAEDTGFEELCCREDFVSARIVEISAYGVMKIKWSKPMQTDTKVEDLKKEVSIFGLDGRETAKIPTLNITYVASESHSTAPTMEWEWLRWVDDRTMALQLTFDKPSIVSMEMPQDNIEVTFNDQSLFTAQDGSYISYGHDITSSIRPQVQPGTITTVVQIAGDVTVQTMSFLSFGGVGLSLFMAFALNYLWGMINALQMAVHLPVFSLQFPGLASVLYKALFQVATFQFLDIEDQVIDIFELDEEDGAFSDEYERMGIESRNFLTGSGLIMPTLALIVPAIVLSTLLALLAAICSCMQRFKRRFDDAFFWNFFIRAMLEGCLEIGMIAMMDVSLYQTQSWGYTTSFALSVTCLTILVFLVIWMRCWLRKQDLEDDKVVVKFGSVYEGLIARDESLIVQEWFIMRRIAFAAAAFFAMGQLWLSFQVLFQSSMITFAFIMRRPHESKASWAIELMNELFLLMLQYHLFTFTDLVQPAETRVLMGLSCVGFTALSILINLIANAVVIGKALVLQCKRQSNRFRAWQRRKNAQRYAAANEGEEDKDELQQNIPLVPQDPKKQHNRTNIKSQRQSNATSKPPSDKEFSPELSEIVELSEESKSPEKRQDSVESLGKIAAYPAVDPDENEPQAQEASQVFKSKSELCNSDLSMSGENHVSEDPAREDSLDSAEIEKEAEKMAVEQRLQRNMDAFLEKEGKRVEEQRKLAGTQRETEAQVDARLKVFEQKLLEFCNEIKLKHGSQQGVSTARDHV